MAMCGIVGFWTADSEVISKEQLESACKLIQHRGPDASNVYVHRGIGLGHQRLSIIDLSEAADQPMIDASGQVVLVYNGELYNFRELRKQLVAHGCNFRTTGDTEVLLQLYLRYGEQCLAHLQGMFAFAIWDTRRRTLFIARDRLGIKPLYYRLNQNTLIFASEIKALLALDATPPYVDRQALHDYLTFRYTISPHTMFHGIKKLPPAHSMLLSESGVKLERYWVPDYRKKERMSDEEWLQALRELVSETIFSHLVSDVPVGVLLSGGLDSSVVAAVMQAGLTRPIKTFSVAFAEGGVYDERPFARKMAQHLGADHYEVCLTAQDFIDALPAFIWHMDEPMADPASIPLYYVSQLARSHVKVVLSGEGSDELLAGYGFWSQFKGYERLKLFKKLPLLMREALNGVNRSLVRSARLDRYLQMSRYPLSAYGAMMPNYQDNVFDEDEKRQLYHTEFLRLSPLGDSVDKVRDAYRSAQDFELLDQMLFVSMTQWLPEDLLVKADKMTMAHSLELRVPFLDHVLVDFIARMPTHLKVRKDGSKYIEKYALKKAFADIIPPEILAREKLGFCVPYVNWFKHEMREMLYDLLLSRTARESGIFNPIEVERLLQAVLSSDATKSHDIWDPRAKKVWSLVVFELWRQRFNAGSA
jgi:asparagine synthase (glutamine-hydrolysing)